MGSAPDDCVLSYKFARKVLILLSRLPDCTRMHAELWQYLSPIPIHSRDYVKDVECTSECEEQRVHSKDLSRAKSGAVKVNIYDKRRQIYYLLPNPKQATVGSSTSEFTDPSAFRYR